MTPTEARNTRAAVQRGEKVSEEDKLEAALKLGKKPKKLRRPKALANQEGIDESLGARLFGQCLKKAA